MRVEDPMLSIVATCRSAFNRSGASVPSPLKFVDFAQQSEQFRRDLNGVGIDHTRIHTGLDRNNRARRYLCAWSAFASLKPASLPDSDVVILHPSVQLAVIECPPYKNRDLGLEWQQRCSREDRQRHQNETLVTKGWTVELRTSGYQRGRSGCDRRAQSPSQTVHRRFQPSDACRENQIWTHSPRL